MEYKEGKVKRQPIIAVDFDEVLCIGSSQAVCDTYPIPPHDGVRKHAKVVMDFLRNLCVKIVIWTCRDISYNYIKYDHITPMIIWLNQNKIPFDGVNDSSKFVPYVYNSRKIYADMYVDDKSIFWSDGEDILLSVLFNFLRVVCKFGWDEARHTTDVCKDGLSPEKWMIDKVKNWMVAEQ